MQENNSGRANQALIRPPRILSSSSARKTDDKASPVRVSQKRSTSRGFMAPTVSSTVRSKRTLSLREKIFELHDAVKELQSKPPSLADHEPS